MKTGAIIQARIASSRLPGKILKDLPFGSGVNVLQHMIRRLKKSQVINEIVVATTENKSDDKLVGIAGAEQVKIFRGSLEDVLSRYYFSAVENSFDTVVRVTGDCPCIDPQVADFIVNEHISGQADYTSNAHCLTNSFPHGSDIEVMSFTAVEQAHKNATSQFDREHVSEYILLNKPGDFKIKLITATDAQFAPEVRITIDTEQDYALLCAVFDYLYPADNFFGTEQIVSLFRKKPWLKMINSKVVNKKVHETDSLEDEIADAVKLLELYEFKKAGELLKRTAGL